MSSSSAGPATVAFSDALDADPLSQFDVQFIAVTPSNVVLDATPASVATGNTSTVSALVTDINGNPVQGEVVEFSSADLRGGTLSPVSSITDSDGRAAVTFTAGSLPTQVNEITIVGTVTVEDDADDSTDQIAAEIAMTVTERQLNVIIGLSGMLAEIDSDTRYRRTGIVQVTDGAGRPVPDATILVTLRPTVYRFGRMIRIDEDNDGAVSYTHLTLPTIYSV